MPKAERKREKDNARIKTHTHTAYGTNKMNNNIEFPWKSANHFGHIFSVANQTKIFKALDRPFWIWKVKKPIQMNVRVVLWFQKPGIIIYIQCFDLKLTPNNDVRMSLEKSFRWVCCPILIFLELYSIFFSRLPNYVFDF